MKRLASSPWSREKVPTGGAAPRPFPRTEPPLRGGGEGGWEEAGTEEGEVTGASAREGLEGDGRRSVGGSGVWGSARLKLDEAEFGVAPAVRSIHGRGEARVSGRGEGHGVPRGAGEGKGARGGAGGAVMGIASIGETTDAGARRCLVARSRRATLKCFARRRGSSTRAKRSNTPAERHMPPALALARVVHADVLLRVLASLERDLASIIEAFDGGYAPGPPQLARRCAPASSVGTVVFLLLFHTTTCASR